MANKPLKTIKFPGLDDTYTIPQVDTTLAVSGAAADAKKTGDELSDLKQDFNEYHPDLGSGYSAQLLSTVFIEDEVPYNFRTSGGSADIGDREYDEIVGVSMPVNQLISTPATKNSTNTDTRTYLSLRLTYGSSFADIGTISSPTVINKILAPNFSGNSVIKHSGQQVDLITASNIPIVSGHKYFLHMNILGANPSEINGFDVDEQMLFDLTLMLGTAIADYVYGLETATSGSGVTWLRHHFPKIFDSGYIPYNAGEMQSVSGLSAHRMTGFNQWNETWEVGAYSSDTGAKVAVSGRIRSKGYIPCLPDTVYQCNKAGTQVYYYDANHNYLGWETVTSGSNRLFTTPTGTAFMTFNAMANTGEVYQHDICINLSWDGERDGEYEPYVEYTYPLDDSLTLRGIPKLDSGNNLYYDGDVYEADGTVTRRYGVVDLGTLTWSVTSAGYFYSTSINTLAKKGNAQIGYVHIRCVLYVAQNVASLNSLADKSMSIDSGGNIQIHDSAYSDSNAFKTAMSGVYLIYELETPTTETAYPFTNPQIVDDFGTEEYITTSIVPVGHVTKYQPNLRAKLEMAPESPDGDGDYIVRQTNGENEYVALGSTTTIQGILDRLTALENA